MEKQQRNKKLLQVFYGLNHCPQPRLAASQQPTAELPCGMAQLPLSPLSPSPTVTHCHSWPWHGLATASGSTCQGAGHCFPDQDFSELLCYWFSGKPVFSETEGGKKKSGVFLLSLVVGVVWGVFFGGLRNGRNAELVKGKEGEAMNQPSAGACASSSSKGAFEVAALHRPWPLGDQTFICLPLPLSPGFVQALVGSCFGKTGRTL